MPERNVKQACTIPSGTYLPNPVGTAPGWWVERNATVITAMPGVPHEMRKMWEEQVVPRLAKRLGTAIIVSRTLKLAGVGESHAEEVLGDLTRSANPTLATYAKPDGVHLRVTAKAGNAGEAERLLGELETRVKEKVGRWHYGYETDNLPMVVGNLLRERGLSLAVAESATGGRLASMITDAPGASDYFKAGFVAYSRAAKEALGVPGDVLERHGTVAKETAVAMARAAREQAGADVAVATTGTAGPTGVEGQPVGVLHLAVDVQGRVVSVETHHLTTRVEFKRRGSFEALTLLWRELRRS
jgi:nicotinamide-nucleotide amidase